MDVVLTPPAVPGAFRRFLSPDRTLVRKVIAGTDIMLSYSRFVAGSGSNDLDLGRAQSAVVAA